MASAWGTSWGTSWGDSWGVTGGVEPPVVVQEQRGGTSKRDKKRRRVIYMSDLKTREEMELAVRQIHEAVEVIPFEEIEDDDDEIILMALRVLH